MFYIAYLRQNQFPQVFGFPEEFPKIGAPVLCRDSCLNDLQIKLLIVFALKTYALKAKEYVIPFLKGSHKKAQKAKKLKTQEANKRGQGAGKAESIPVAIQGDKDYRKFYEKYQAVPFRISRRWPFNLVTLPCSRRRAPLRRCWPS
jgi:hypothetical protein